MNCREAHEIPIPVLLETIGVVPVHRTSRGVWYHSPFSRSQDRRPSLQVSPDGHAFHDWSSGLHGDIIDLARELAGSVSVSDCLQWISNLKLAPMPPNAILFADKKKKESGGFVDVKVGALHSDSLWRYAYNRGISRSVLSRYCYEVRYRLRGHLRPYSYYAIGWRNDSGGFELRNAYVKQALAPKDITTIGDMAECTYYIYEGFFDFLSAVEMGWFSEMEGTAIILNSTAMVERAIPILLQNAKEVHCYLDNDDAGRKITAKIQTVFPHAMDFSSFYRRKGYNDVNEMLVGNSIKA